MIKLLFDTETTGLLKPSANSVDEQPEIIELYACKIDDDYNLLDEWDSLFKPKYPITEEITKITGINDDMVKASPAFAEKVDELAEFFTGVDEIIAHNLPFDRSMLANELIRCDRLIQFPWPRIHTCTVELSMEIEQRRLNLATLHTYATGKPHEGAHRAREDVHAVVRCYHWLQERKENE